MGSLSRFLKKTAGGTLTLLIMEDPRHIRIKDFSYPLEDSRIAKFPLSQRDHSKLLVYDKKDISEDVFMNVDRYLEPGEMIVFNNTRVIQARMHFHRKSGARIEVFLLEPYCPADYALNFQSQHQTQWLCLIGNLKKLKDEYLEKELQTPKGDTILRAQRLREEGTSHLVSFTWDNENLTFSDILEYFGELPIPPYLNRETQESDKTTYQTVYSKIKGSVAAPTAGLHFTPDVLERLRKKGCDMREITLHVGAGTFKPVKSEQIEGHEMHTEWISVPRAVIQALIEHDGWCTAVGTTSVRTLESLYHIGLKLLEHPNADPRELHVSQWQPYEPGVDNDIPSTVALKAILDYLDRGQLTSLDTSTQIIIAPGYQFHIIRKMITNFHQSESTLLLLVSAFLHGDWRSVYDYALSHEFRFLSYGDSSILIP